MQLGARVVLGLLWLVHLLPVPVVAALGALLGSVLYALAGSRRQVCLTNLARCFPGRTPMWHRSIARAHFRALARSLLDRGVLRWSSRDRVVSFVRVLGLEHVRQAAARGPVILLVPHFVGLDAAVTRLLADVPLTGLYSMQKQGPVNDFLLSMRARLGKSVPLSRQDGVRPLLRAMRDGYACYYLPDMDYGPRDAIFVPFFGVPAATITGLSRLARLSRATVVPCVATLLDRPGADGAAYEVRLLPALADYPGEDVESDTRRMNAWIEEQVLAQTAQYLWTHKRFKTRPEGEPAFYP
jgi:KDO2-lipid IV(A) lauroyltransferase